MSALPPKADIAQRNSDVRFVPKADILRCGKNAVIRSPRQRGRDAKPEGLRGLDVDHQLESGRLLDWEIGRPIPF
jgi:hypothetical protein